MFDNTRSPDTFDPHTAEEHNYAFEVMGVKVKRENDDQVMLDLEMYSFDRNEAKN